MSDNLLPNCEYLQYQAGRINSLGISEEEAQLASFKADLQQLIKVDIPNVTNELAEEIFRQELLADNPLTDSDLDTRDLLSTKFQLSESMIEVMKSRENFTIALIACKRRKRTKIESKIAQHEILWHSLGRNRCYRTGDSDPMSVRLGAIVRQVGDAILRRT